MAPDPNRRTFLTAAAAPLAAAWQISPADTIRLGLIGCGGRSRDLLAEVQRSGEKAAIRAVCDVWSVNREARAADVERAFGAAPRETTRYQELLAMKDLDAVIVATPDFTHSRILMDAVAAGKDVYVEKPFAIEFSEAKAAWQAVKRSRQVVQVGTQRRSEPLMAGAARAIQGGAIGKVTRVDLSVNFQEPRWHRDLTNVQAADVDWEAFRFGGRIEGPFDASKLREWQLHRETSNGIPGLWMSHYADQMAWFLNDPYPQRVSALGGVYLWKDGRDTTDVFHSLLEYGDCLVSFAMSLTNSAGNSNLWCGTKGTLDLEKGVITGEGSTRPDRIESAIAIEKPAVESHMANFLRAMRTRETPRASVDAGFSHAVAGTMAAMSLATGRHIRFDRERLELV